MDTAQILTLLVEERDRLNNAIAALRGQAASASGPRNNSARSDTAKSSASKAQNSNGNSRTGRRSFTAAQRKQQAERMKAYWAARRAEQAKGATAQSRKRAKAA